MIERLLRLRLRALRRCVNCGRGLKRCSGIFAHTTGESVTSRPAGYVHTTGDPINCRPSGGYGIAERA